MRDWGYGIEQDDAANSRLRFASGRFGWCGSIRANTPRNGRRSRRLRRRSAARRRRCATGFGRPSGTRASAGGLTSDERERLKALERENRELRQANEILRKASAYFAQAELDRRFKP